MHKRQPNARGRAPYEQRTWQAALELAAIVDSSDDAILSKGIDGTIRSWNRAAERLYGYTAEEAVGRSISMLVPPEHAGEEHQILARISAGERVEHFETERLRSDGSRVTVSLSVSPMRDPAGEVVGASIIARDVTERVAADAVRRELELTQRFRAAFINAPLGMALVSVRPETFGRLLDTNAALRRMTGYGERDLVATSLQSLAHPDDHEGLMEAARAVMAGEVGTCEREVRLMHAAGQPLWTALTASLMQTPDGRPLHLLALVQDITERKRFEGQLQYLADHDAMTGLFNRRRFEQELERQLAYAGRYGKKTGVAVLDIDNFKYANDTFGHKVGDDVIAAVARVLREHLRKTDLLGRLGGDEFGIVLPETDFELVTSIIEHTLDKIRTEVGVEGRGTRFTASAGVVLVSGDAELTSEELLVAADIAMYEAKQSGRDRLAVYSEALQERTRARQTWVDRIRHALEHDEFLLYGQPILNLFTGAVEQHELLIRMQGSGDDVIPPGVFLPTAERFGLIDAIDRWVVAQAIDLLESQCRAGMDLCLEVNLSGQSVTDPQIPLLVEQATTDRRIDPSKLLFEVTETAAIENILDARRFADRMRGLGCRFALDDFGAGFGSFYYLKYLPFDYLKIDGEFIKNVLTGPTDQLVVRAIVDLARGLGKRTIAEFVGDDDTMALLRSYGVDHAQGFHVGHPRPIDELVAATSAATA